MTAPSGDFSDFIVSLAERQAPPAPDTTGGELRSARNALAKLLGQVLADNGVSDPAVRAGIGVDFLGSPALHDLLTERDKLAAQVQACERLAEELAHPHHSDDVRWSAGRIRRALGTPTTGGGE